MSNNYEIDENDIEDFNDFEKYYGIDEEIDEIKELDFYDVGNKIIHDEDINNIEF